MGFASTRSDAESYDPATGVGGQHDKWCKELAEVNYAERSNWQRITTNEAIRLHADLGNMSSYGWPVAGAGYWTSTVVGNQLNLVWLKDGLVTTSDIIDPTMGVRFYGACTSEEQ